MQYNLVNFVLCKVLYYEQSRVGFSVWCSIFISTFREIFRMKLHFAVMSLVSREE